MEQNGAWSTSLERYRAYLHLLGHLQLDARLQGKVDLSGVVQVTLLEAAAANEQVRRASDAERLTWLRRVFANNLTDEIRKLGAQMRDVDRELSLEEALERSSQRIEGWLAAEQSSPSERAERGEQLLRLAEALAQLPPDQRRAVEMHHLQGASLADIAAALERSKEAVAGLLYRGLCRLRELMVKEPDTRS